MGEMISYVTCQEILEVNVHFAVIVYTLLCNPSNELILDHSKGLHSVVSHWLKSKFLSVSNYEVK